MFESTWEQNARKSNETNTHPEKNQIKSWCTFFFTPLYQLHPEKNRQQMQSTNISRQSLISGNKHLKQSMLRSGPWPADVPPTCSWDRYQSNPTPTAHQTKAYFFFLPYIINNNGDLGHMTVSCTSPMHLLLQMLGTWATRAMSLITEATMWPLSGSAAFNSFVSHPWSQDSAV